MSIIAKLKRWILSRVTERNEKGKTTVSVPKRNMKRGSNCRLSSAHLRTTNETRRQERHTQGSITRSIVLNVSTIRNFTMRGKSGSNMYKDGVLIHRPEWGNPQVPDNYQMPMGRMERKALLKKSNLKRLYKKLIGDENT